MVKVTSLLSKAGSVWVQFWSQNLGKGEDKLPLWHTAHVTITDNTSCLYIYSVLCLSDVMVSQLLSLQLFRVCSLIEVEKVISPLAWGFTCNIIYNKGWDLPIGINLEQDEHSSGIWVLGILANNGARQNSLCPAQKEAVNFFTRAMHAQMCMGEKMPETQDVELPTELSEYTDA